MAHDRRAATAAIETRVRDNWSRTPIEWSGTDFDPKDAALGGASCWIRPTVLWGDAFEETQGGDGVAEHTTIGVLQLSVFFKPGRGKGEAQSHADTLANLFSGRTLDGIRFDPASGPRSGPAMDGWEQVIVTVRFEVDEIAP